MEKIKFLNCKEILVLFKDLSKYNENMLNDVSENIKLYHKSRPTDGGSMADKV